MDVHLEKKLREVVGLDFWGTGFRKKVDTDGNILDEVEILSLWCAVVRLHAQMRFPFVVSVVESNKWRRAVVLRQTKLSRTYDEQEKTSKPTIPEYAGNRYLEMPQDWEDPVVTALHSVDLMFWDAAHYLGSGVYRYWLYIDTGATTTEFMCRYNRSPSLMQLWDALRKNLHHFVELYDDDELRQRLAMPGEPGYREVVFNDLGIKWDKDAPPIDFKRRRGIRRWSR